METFKVSFYSQPLACVTFCSLLLALLDWTLRPTYLLYLTALSPDAVTCTTPPSPPSPSHHLRP